MIQFPWFGISVDVLPELDETKAPKDFDYDEEREDIEAEWE